MPDPLARLARLSPTAVFLVTLGVALVALFAPGQIGAGLLLLLAAGLAALLVRTWPIQPPATRLLRLLILAVLVVVALAKLA